LELYEAAYETAKADAERMCPSKTFQSATGIEGLGRKDTYWWIETQKELIVYFLEQIEEARKFGERVPEEASDTRNAVKDLIEGHEKSIERARTDQARYEKWLEEHGNETDM
jgi:ketosteroid isomerase-like protein